MWGLTALKHGLCLSDQTVHPQAFHTAYCTILAPLGDEKRSLCIPPNGHSERQEPLQFPLVQR